MKSRQLIWATPLMVLLSLIMAPAAMASSVPPDSPTLVLPNDQVWVMLIGSLVPMATYLLNHYGPQLSEQVKGVVQVVAASIAGALQISVVCEE